MEESEDVEIKNSMLHLNGTHTFYPIEVLPWVGSRELILAEAKRCYGNMFDSDEASEQESEESEESEQESQDDLPHEPQAQLRKPTNKISPADNFHDQEMPSIASPPSPTHSGVDIDFDVEINEIENAIDTQGKNAIGDMFIREIDERKKCETPWWKPVTTDDAVETNKITSTSLWGETLDSKDENDKNVLLRYRLITPAVNKNFNRDTTNPSAKDADDDPHQDNNASKGRLLAQWRTKLEEENSLIEKLKSIYRPTDLAFEENYRKSTQYHRSLSRLFNLYSPYDTDPTSNGIMPAKRKLLPSNWFCDRSRQRTTALMIDFSDPEIMLPFEETSTFQSLRAKLRTEWDSVRELPQAPEEKLLEEFKDIPLEKLTDEQKKKRQLAEKKIRMGALLGTSLDFGVSVTGEKRENHKLLMELIPNLDKQLDTPFDPLESLNVSQDQFWLERRLHVRANDRGDKQGEAVRHSSIAHAMIGGLKVANSNSLSRIHRPDLRWALSIIYNYRGVIVQSGASTVRVVANKIFLSPHTPVDSRLNANDLANTQNIFRTTSLAEDASFGLIEFIEQHPLVLQLPGMGCRITKFYCPSSEIYSNDYETLLESRQGSFGDCKLVTNNVSVPLLNETAKLLPGQHMALMETGVSKCALYMHQPNGVRRSQYDSNTTNSSTVGGANNANDNDDVRNSFNDMNIINRSCSTDFLLVINKTHKHRVHVVLRPLISYTPPNASKNMEEKVSKTNLLLNTYVTSRCKANLFITGQLEPLLEIPMPGTKEAEKILRHRIISFIQNCDPKIPISVAEVAGKFRLEETALLFPGVALSKSLTSINRVKQFIFSTCTSKLDRVDVIKPETCCIYMSIFDGLWRLKKAGIKYLMQEKFSPERIGVSVLNIRNEVETEKKRYVENSVARCEQYKKYMGSIPSTGDPGQKLLNKLYKFIRYGKYGDLLVSACRYIEENILYTPWFVSSEYISVTEKKDGEFSIAFSTETMYGKSDFVNFVRSKNGRNKRKGLIGPKNPLALQNKGMMHGNDNIDLRKLTMDELSDKLIQFGMKSNEIAAMPRWDRVRMLSVQAEHLRNKGLATTETEALVRANHQLKVLPLQSYYKDELSRVFQNGLKILMGEGGNDEEKEREEGERKEKDGGGEKDDMDEDLSLTLADIEKQLSRDTQKANSAQMYGNGGWHGLSNEEKEKRRLDMFIEEQERKRKLQTGAGTAQTRLIPRVKWTRVRKKGIGFSEEKTLWIVGEENIKAFEEWRIRREKRKSANRTHSIEAAFKVGGRQGGGDYEPYHKRNYGGSSSGGHGRKARGGIEEDDAANELEVMQALVMHSRGENTHRRSKRENIDVPSIDINLLAPLKATATALSVLHKLNKIFEYVLEKVYQIDGNPSKWFINEVRERDAPEYYDIISEPITLKDLKQLANKRLYVSINHFDQHLKLLCDNAEIYNGTNHIVSTDAKKIRSFIYNILTESYQKNIITDYEKFIDSDKDLVDATIKLCQLKRKEQIERVRAIAVKEREKDKKKV